VYITPIGRDGKRTPLGTDDCTTLQRRHLPTVSDRSDK